jgi:thiol-disulfide isomerase/thioredoxin
MRSSEFAGRVTVVNFFGTWCTPCRQELPRLQALYETWHPQGVRFVAIDWERPAPYEEQRRRVVQFTDALAISVPVVLDTAHAAVDAFRVDGFPTTFVIDAAGDLRYRNLGFSPGDDLVLEEQIRRLVAAPRGRP